METLYYSVDLGNDRTLCISELTDRLISLSGQEINERGGYFLYERRARGAIVDIEVIAHVLSEEAALRLGQAFNMK